MQKNSENLSIQEAMRLAGTPAGQELLARLRNDDPISLQKATELAGKGDYAQAMALLKNLLQDPQIQALLSRLGR